MHTKLFSVTDGEFENHAKKALKYALISGPFTVNRMAIDDLPKRIENIVKGKLAELMVGAFLKSQNVEVDFERCQTPFYQTDNHDFIYGGYEWDIKNNYLNLGAKNLNDVDFSIMPALIPNRFNGDQWSKRETTFHNTKGLRMLFTFMIRQKKVDGVTKNVFDLHIETDQLEFMSALVNKHDGRNYETTPFAESWFWHEWQHRSLPWSEPLLSVNFNSPILIAGWAGQEHWPKFKMAKPRSWAGGLMKTRIENKYLECWALNEFIPAS